jgi:hypothetical protein
VGGGWGQRLIPKFAMAVIIVGSFLWRGWTAMRAPHTTRSRYTEVLSQPPAWRPGFIRICRYRWLMRIYTRISTRALRRVFIRRVYYVARGVCSPVGICLNRAPLDTYCRFLCQRPRAPVRAERDTAAARSSRLTTFASNLRLTPWRLTPPNTA